jgi:hypothetical protein
MTRAKPTSEVLSRLKAAAGAGSFLDDAQEMAPHLVEWRERFRGATSLVLMPASVAAIQEIVRICGESGTAIVPQGGFNRVGVDMILTKIRAILRGEVQ